MKKKIVLIPPHDFEFARTIVYNYESKLKRNYHCCREANSNLHGKNNQIFRNYISESVE